MGHLYASYADLTRYPFSVACGIILYRTRKAFDLLTYPYLSYSSLHEEAVKKIQLSRNKKEKEMREQKLMNIS